MYGSNKNFSVKNYVGEYEWKEINGNDFIVSKQCYDFFEREDDDKQIKPKDLSIDSFKDGKLPSLLLTNININDKDAILKYCNTYGLPISTSLIHNLTQFYTNEEEEYYYKYFSNIPEYHRKERASLYEIQRIIIMLRRLMNIQIQINLPFDKRNSKDMFENLMSLLLFQNLGVHSFDRDLDEAFLTPTMRFQYEFLQHYELDELINTPCSERIDKFLQLNTEKRMSNYINKLFDVLSELNRSDFIHNIKIDEFGSIIVDGNYELSEELTNKLYEIAPTVMSDYINESLKKTRITLNHEKSEDGNIEFYTDWHFPFQYHGLLMEFLIMISSSKIILKCQNPLCDNFYVMKSKKNKKYCCEYCARSVAKQKYKYKNKVNTENNDSLKETESPELKQ